MLRSWLRQRVREVVAERPAAPSAEAVRALREALAPAAERAAEFEARLSLLGHALDRLERLAALRGLPPAALGPDSPVEAALRSHPGAARVLRRHGLPDCTGCAVRADESLAEAAAAYGADIDRLLGELRALGR